MIAPIKQPTHKRSIKLLPQKKGGTYTFRGKFVAAINAIDKFGEAVIVACHMMLLKEVKRRGGLDYLEVFEVDGEKLCFIDDVSHITRLLPEDY